MLARPVTVTKDGDRGLMVLRLAATDAGTELAFEIRDPRLEEACATGRVDYRAPLGEIHLRDAAGTEVPRIPGAGNGISFGGNRFGTFGRKALFASVATDAVMLEVRGELGDWDVPLELVPIAHGAVVQAKPIDAADERNGVTVRVAAIAQMEDRTVVDVRATASPSTKAIEIGAWLTNQGRDAFALIDEDGRRLEEISMRDRMEMRRISGTTVVIFPRTESPTLTLIVPAVVVQESEGTLEFELPIVAPTDLFFGEHPVRIRYARAVDALPTMPGEAPQPGIEVQFGPAVWHDERRVLFSGPVFVDGVYAGHGMTARAEPGVATVTIPLKEPTTARKVTMREPVLAVRGPWEVHFSAV